MFHKRCQGAERNSKFVRPSELKLSSVRSDGTDTDLSVDTFMFKLNSSTYERFSFTEDNFEFTEAQNGRGREETDLKTRRQHLDSIKYDLNERAYD